MIGNIHSVWQMPSPTMAAKIRYYYGNVQKLVFRELLANDRQQQYRTNCHIAKFESEIFL